MSTPSIPSWSTPASKSIGLLYRRLQPIEVYVEDSNSEAFYFELLNRMIEGNNKIKKIIPLHGRRHVISHCENHNHRTPALFLIDGDLDLFFNNREQGKINLFQHRAYCVENYLICQNAVRELIVEASGTILRENALPDAEWALVQAPFEQLKQLFITFAAARVADPELKTVSHGFPAIITQVVRKQPPIIDPAKISTLDSKISEACIKKVGRVQWASIRARVEHGATGIAPIDGVSGKDFLLPIIDHFIRSKGCNTLTTPSLMFKLAKYCSLNRLEELKMRLHDVLNGRNFVSH